MKKKIVTIVGARPQFIKAAPLSRLLAHHPHLHEVMIHTGQHHDAAMSDIFFEELQIPSPAYQLSISGGGHGGMTGRMLEALEPVLLQEKPHAVIVYGDTNSTLAGALAAAKIPIPVVHIEAGLRSFNRHMPEEINRVVVDHLSTLLLCPTPLAVKNLATEGIRTGVHHVGDIMYDATLFAIAALAERPSLLEKFDFLEEPFALLTLHRAASTTTPETLQELLDYACTFAQKHSLRLIFPVHPRTRQMLPSEKPPQITFLEPLSYFEMHGLLQRAYTVLTDSGGLQKEAYFHHVPCITLRSETEWVETVECGWNRLWTHENYQIPRVAISSYGKGGTVAQTIVTALEQMLGC